MCKLKRARGQNLTEIALCISVITAAILGMQIYVQRSLQARYKAGPDYVFRNIGAQGIDRLNNIRQQQYDPYYRESSITETAPDVGGPNVRELHGEPTPIHGRWYDNYLTIDATSKRVGWVKTGPPPVKDMDDED